MKKTIVSVLIMLLLSVVSAQAADYKLNAGIWMMNWEQKSDNAARFGASAIDVDYTMSEALALTASLSASMQNLTAELNLTQSGSGENEESMQQYAALLNYTNLIGPVDLNFRYVSSHFEGEFYGVDPMTDEFAWASWESDVTFYDIALFWKYLGFGYRTVTYEVPQDLYLVENALPNSVATDGTNEIKGAADMKYEGQFFQIILDNSLYVNQMDSYNGIAYSARYGIGVLKPTADFLDAWEEAYGEKLIDDGDATFLEADLGWKYVATSDSYSYNIYAGYRYSEFTAEFSPDSDGDFSFVNDFTTTFSGPFVEVGVQF